MNKILLWLAMFIVLSSLAFASLVIIEPVSGTISGFEKSPLISWSGCSSESYLLQIATDELFTQMLFQKVVFQNFFKLDFALTSDSYYFRVLSISPQGDFSCTSQINSYELREASPLGVSFHKVDYENTNIVKVIVSGPSDAKLNIDITSSDGFHLPIFLDDLSNPSFEVVLEPNRYVFKATSSYLDDELLLERILDLSVQDNQVVVTNSLVDDGLNNFSILVEEFDGSPLTDLLAYAYTNSSNFTFSVNGSGHASGLFKNGTFTLVVQKKGYVQVTKIYEIVEDVFQSIILLSFEEAGISTIVQEETKQTIFEELPVVTLIDFETTVLSSSYVPILYELSGYSPRCQVLTKSIFSDSYSITQTVLDPKGFNEVILTNLAEGEYDVRIRCIVAKDKAIVSQINKIQIIDVADDIAQLTEFQTSSQKVLDKINSFPISFKQVFIDEIISLENAVAKSKELRKKIQSSSNILELRTNIRSLLNKDSKLILSSISVDSNENIIAYVSLDDVDIVIDYLDLSKKNKQLLAEQELFAIKTNYNFVTLTYSSGLIKKQTFVSNQVIPVEGTSFQISFDEYIILPTFLTSRLEKSNDVLIKEYGDASLARLLENTSALIFTGWLDDVSLIRTVILADDFSYSNTPTGFVVSDISIPEWKIPLISFIILILIAGLLFNPYVSVLTVFTKNPLDEFTSQVHSCIDSSLSKEYFQVINLVPQILDKHQRLSSDEKQQVSGILKKVEELFYESSYHLSLQKISSKPAHLWSLVELEVAIKDFYGSYSQLSSQKQQEYLPYFNQMIAHSQELILQVKK